MEKPNRLYKTTIVIWTDFPTSSIGIEDLARETQVGDAFCESSECVEISNKKYFPETAFFGDE